MNMNMYIACILYEYIHMVVYICMNIYGCMYIYIKYMAVYTHTYIIPSLCSGNDNDKGVAWRILSCLSLNYRK